MGGNQVDVSLGLGLPGLVRSRLTRSLPLVNRMSASSLCDLVECRPASAAPPDSDGRDWRRTGHRPGTPTPNRNSAKSRVAAPLSGTAQAALAGGGSTAQTGTVPIGSQPPPPAHTLPPHSDD
jgi:hypothetical protein